MQCNDRLSNWECVWVESNQGFSLPQHEAGRENKFYKNFEPVPSLITKKNLTNITNDN